MRYLKILFNKFIPLLQLQHLFHRKTLESLWESSKIIKYSLGKLIYYVRKIFRKTNIPYPPARTSTCAYQKVRNVTFFETEAYVVNGWSLSCEDEKGKIQKPKIVTGSQLSIVSQIVNCHCQLESCVIICYSLLWILLSMKI